MTKFNLNVTCSHSFANTLYQSALIILISSTNKTSPEPKLLISAFNILSQQSRRKARCSVVPSINRAALLGITSFCLFQRNRILLSPNTTLYPLYFFTRLDQAPHTIFWKQLYSMLLQQANCSTPPPKIFLPRASRTPFQTNSFSAPSTTTQSDFTRRIVPPINLDNCQVNQLAL